MSRKKLQPTLGLPDRLLACLTLTLTPNQHPLKRGGGGKRS